MSLRRKLLAVLHNQKKDAEYTELAYLESTGTQWIDTGFNGYATIELKAQGAETATSSQVVVGATSAGGNFFGAYSSTNKWGVGVDTGLSDLAYTDIGTFTIYFKNNKTSFDLNGVNYVREDNSTVNTDYNYYLFRCFGLGASNYYSKAKIFYCKIWDENDKLIRDLIPVLDKDFVPCMYDKVTGKFFYNQGTGEFEWKLPNQLEYIRTENNSYTIIDVITDGSYTIEAKCRAVSIPDTAVRNFGGYMWQGDSVTYNNPRSGIGCYNSRWHVGYNKTGQAGTCDTNLHIFKLVEFLKFGENFNADYFSVDGEQLAISHASSVDFYSNTRRNWAIGGRIQSTGFKNPLDAEHYWWKFWDGDDKLVAYIIPVFDENLTPCFYDLVSKKYFYNKGSGSFTYE